MVRTWQELTAEKVLNLFLYGRETRPTNLVDDSLIREPNDTPPPIKVDAVSFMADGPGRFVTPSMVPLIDSFFTSNDPLLDGNGAKQVIPLSVMAGWLGSETNFSYQQYDFDSADLGYRALIWGSSGFKLTEAHFIIEADGTRKVEDIKILPFDDNYDFESDDTLTQLVEDVAKDWTDPSGIGRRVDFEFENKANVLATNPHTDPYTSTDYSQDQADEPWILGSAANFASLYNDVQLVTNPLFDNQTDGPIRFLDGNKPIIYGTTGADTLDYTIAEGETVTGTYLSPYIQNGIEVAPDGALRTAAMKEVVP